VDVEAVLAVGKSNALAELREFVRQAGLEAPTAERQSYGYRVAECRLTYIDRPVCCRA